MPFSLAIFFANGEATTLPPVGVTVSVTIGLGSVLWSCCGFISDLGASILGEGASFPSELEKSPFLMDSTNLEISAFLSPIIAKTESTFADSPSLTPTYNRVPW